jgi:hypothetical protein
MTEDARLALPGAGWSDGRWLLLLLVVVALMRLWQLCHTEVASRDSIAYIHYAWRLETEPWPLVILTSEHHPGYPFAVHLLSKPVQHLLPDDRPRAMQLSAQLVSCLASLLLIFPMYFIGRELFDRRIAFWATLLYQCLPGPGRVLADGLSDPLFLWIATTSVWFALVALRKGKPGWFVLVGATSALAYLTRTEGALVALVTGLVLLGLQATQRWRRSWADVGRSWIALAGSAALLAGPFMLFIGGLTLKPSARHLLEEINTQRHGQDRQRDVKGWVSAPLPLALWKFGEGTRPQDRVRWAAWAIVVELDKGFFHALGGPALLGLLLFRRRFGEVPGLWVMSGCGICLCLLLYQVGWSNGYVGERHILLIVMGGVYFAVATLVVFGSWLGRFLSRWRPGLCAGSTISLMLLVLVTIAPLSRTLTRLHADRYGFKQAGLWLADNAKADDGIWDPFAWAWYYAGRAFQQGEPTFPAVCYVVLEQSKNQHQHLEYKLRDARELVQTRKAVKLAELVKSFPLRKGKESARVEVYRVRLHW